MRQFFIIDTNVVVAGLLTERSDSPVAKILDGMLSAAFSFVLSKELLAEYSEVLMRPKLCKLHGLSADEVDTVLRSIAQHAIMLKATSGLGNIAPDAGDQFLWDLLAARKDLVLVTGDKLLLAAADMSPRVITAQALHAAELL